MQNLIKAPFGKRMPCLDGVRGIAILLVMCTHLLPSQPIGFVPLEYLRKIFEAGWIGVDLFFVLSGFLITGILLDSRDRDNALSTFYVRRSLRIFPLYYFVLSVAFIIIPILGISYEGQATHEANQFWLWTYGTNFFIAYQNSYFFTGEGFQLAHLWSLAVEEHFYLVWPFAALFLSPKTLLRLTLAGIAGAFVLRCSFYFSGASGLVNYVLTVCRMDSLMLGALLAQAVRMPDARKILHSSVAICLPLTGIILATILVSTKGLWISHWTMQTVGFSSLGIFFASCIFILLEQKDTNPVKRIISSSALRLLGKYSYGLYIYHSILDPYVTKWFPADFGPFASIPFLGPLSIFVFRLAPIIPIVLVSYHCIEAPFLRLKDRFGKPHAEPEEPTLPASAQKHLAS